MNCMTLALNGLLLNTYFLFFYALALIASIYSYRWYYHTILKYFPILIGYTLINEVLGYLIWINNDIQIVYTEGFHEYNNLIYNIFDIIFFLYFYYVFWNTITDQKSKRMVFLGSLLFILSSIINPFFQDFFIFAQVWASSVGSMVLIICIIFYFAQKKPSIGTHKNSDILIWIGSGLLIFYTFYPFFLIIGQMDYGLFQKLHIRKIQHFLIALMYLSMTIGFLRMRRPYSTVYQVNQKSPDG